MKELKVNATEMYVLIKKRAMKAGIEMDIRTPDIHHMFARAKGKCELSGIPFSEAIVNGNKRPFYPSVDRINSTRGYTRTNCRLVCSFVNLAMNEWGEIVWYVMQLAAGGAPVVDLDKLLYDKRQHEQAMAKLELIDQILNNQASVSHAKLSAIRRCLNGSS